jgi:hypothetical protein
MMVNYRINNNSCYQPQAPADRKTPRVAEINADQIIPINAIDQHHAATGRRLRFVCISGMDDADATFDNVEYYSPLI